MNDVTPQNENKTKALEEKYRFLYIEAVKPKGYTMIQHKVFSVFDGVCMFVDRQYEYCLFYNERTYYALDMDVWILHFFNMIQTDVAS